MSQLHGWHSAVQHLKRAYKDESVVSNIATANYDEDILDEGANMDLVNADENMSFRSCIPMLSDKYEVGNTHLDLQFDTTMPGIIDVSSIQGDESEMNKCISLQQDRSKLDLSDLVEKPTDELHVDLADDMIHATEDLSECGGSDSETEGGDSIIMNVWNEDYEGNPDPKVLDKLLKAKHLPRNIDPYVLGKIKRAQIIKQIKDLEDDDSSQGSCAMILNRMCMPKFCDAEEFTDEGSLVSMETSSLMESVKETSIVGSIDSEDFQFKRPKRSQYALIPDNQFKPGFSPEQLVLMLPKHRRDLSHVPIQKANYETDDDDSSSEGKRTYAEHEMEFTLRKYDRTPHRIAQIALSGKTPHYDSCYDTDASSLGQSMSMEIEEEIVDLDECVLVRRRIIGDEDPIEEDRSVVSELQTETNAPPPVREPIRKSPLTALVEIFTDPNFRLHHSNLKGVDDAVEPKLVRPESEVPDASTIKNEEEPKEINASNKLAPRPLESDQTSRAEIGQSDEVSISDHGNSQDLNNMSNELLSESIVSNNENSENDISYNESESGVSESSGQVIASEESSSPAADSFEDGGLEISKATRVQSASSEAEDRALDGALTASSMTDRALDGAPTTSSMTEGDGLSLNPVGSSYSFNNQENCTMNMENELKKGRGFDESCDELDHDVQTEQLFVRRQSLVPQSLRKNNCAGDEDSTASPHSNGCCDPVVSKKSNDDDLSQTSTDSGVDDLIDALDMTLTLQITNTASYSTADGEEMVIAKTVEGIMVEQPTSMYGRIITPEEFESLQQSLCNNLEKVPENDIADVSSLGGEIGGEDVDMTDINNSIESEYTSSLDETESMKSDDCTSHSDYEEIFSEDASVDEEKQSVESNVDSSAETDGDRQIFDGIPANEAMQDIEEEIVAEEREHLDVEVKSDASLSPAQDRSIDILSDESIQTKDEQLSERPTYALNTPSYSELDPFFDVDATADLREASAIKDGLTYALNTPSYSELDPFFDVDATPSPTAEKREAGAIKDGLTEDIRELDSMITQLRDESYMTADESPAKSEAGQKHNIFELDSMIDHLRDESFMQSVDDTCSEHSMPSMNTKVNMDAADDTSSEKSMPSMIDHLRDESFMHAVEDTRSEQSMTRMNSKVNMDAADDTSSEKSTTRMISTVSMDAAEDTRSDHSVARIKSLAAIVAMDPTDDNNSEDSMPRMNSQVDLKPFDASDSGIASITFSPPGSTEKQKPSGSRHGRSTYNPVASTSTPVRKAKNMRRTKRKSPQIPCKKQPGTSIVDDLANLRKIMERKNSGRLSSRVTSTSLLDTLVDSRKKSSSKQIAELKKSLRL